MAIYRYVKSVSVARNDLPAISSRKSARRRMAMLLVGLGLLIVIYTIYPIAYYQLILSPRFQKPISPVALAQSEYPTVSVMGAPVNLIDLTKSENWYPEFNYTSFDEESPTDHYTLTIPRLNIDNAQVIIGGRDLNSALVQYPGTGYPGKKGNPVIFGHSILPQFYRPASYKTIFSYLPRLTIGDDMYIDYNHTRYRYVIDSMVEVGPQELSILAQHYDDSYIVLVTCVPPGTYLRRLLVRGRLTKI